LNVKKWKGRNFLDSGGQKKKELAGDATPADRGGSGRKKRWPANVNLGSCSKEWRKPGGGLIVATKGRKTS